MIDNKGLKSKAAVVVLDGFGLDPAMEWRIAERVWEELPEVLRRAVTALEPDDKYAAASLAPTSHGVARVLAADDWFHAFEHIRTVRTRLLASLEKEETALLTGLVARTGEKLRYVPWSVDTPYLFALRQDNPTWITRTAGVFTGHEDITPEIMGNSDTGHQQIFNLTVARQIPAAISAMIEDSSFFTNDHLNADLGRAKNGATVVLKTLLSGEFGDDGYVHSAWRHMLAFFKLYFEVLGLPAENLRIEAVLDGRDSPFYSSLRFEEKDGVKRYGYLHKLLDVLKQYGGEKCLAWIIGRQFMDRDYKGEMIRKEYELVTANRGRKVTSAAEALALVAADHDAGQTDPMVEPIVIGEPRPVGENTVFFNAVFRADRQEPITACLAGATDFIREQATQKGRLETWDDFSWLKTRNEKPETRNGLTLWSMIDYHEELAAKGVKSIYKDHPHEHNILYLLNLLGTGRRFLFLTEGVKEKHMGLFSRGRRSTPLAPAETQKILPSMGKDEGVASDNDLYKVPQMRHPEITAELVKQLRDSTFDILAANYPGADMIGHLVGNHFEACRQSVLSLEAALQEVVPAALERGWFLVLTSDHGNVEHCGPDHGNNDVLTSLIIPEASTLKPVPPPNYEARLFDISWTLLKALGVTVEELNAPAIPDDLSNDPRRLVGASLVAQDRPGANA